jgi:hypothetical protein
LERQGGVPNKRLNSGCDFFASELCLKSNHSSWLNLLSASKSSLSDDSRFLLYLQNFCYNTLMLRSNFILTGSSLPVFDAAFPWQMSLNFIQLFSTKLLSLLRSIFLSNSFTLEFFAKANFLSKFPKRNKASKQLKKKIFDFFF